jgi:hypothetical protein
MVGEPEIQTLLASNPEPQAAADALVEAANRAGGQDNITAVVIDVVDEDTASTGAVPATTATPEEDPSPAAPTEVPAAEAERPSRDLTGQGFSMGPRRGGGWARRLLLWVLIPLLLIGGGLWAAKTYWVDRQFYVGETAGHVAVFRGIPAEPLGYELSQPVEEFPELQAESVTVFPEYAGLADGITAESEEDARAIVAEIQRAVAAAERDQQAGG